MRWIAHSLPTLLTCFSTAILLSSCRPKSGIPSDEASSQLSRTIVVERVIESSAVEGGLRQPVGIVVGRSGAIYLADSDNNRVILFDSTFRVVRVAGGFGGGDSRLSKPSWLTVDNDLSVIVSDFGDRRLCRFDAELHFVNEVPFYSTVDPLRFSYPTGIMADRHGELWVGDRDNGRIAVIGVNGQFDRFVGTTSGAGMLRNPEKILSDGDRTLVCDAGNYRIAVFDVFGGFVRDFGSNELRNPSGLCRVNRDYFVVDKELHRVFQYNSDGMLLEIFGPLLPGNNTPLLAPSDIATIPGGRIVISDSGNNRLVICRLVEGQ